LAHRLHRVAPGPTMKAWLAGDEVAAFAAFWDLFEARYVEISDAMRSAAEQVAPSFARSLFCDTAQRKEPALGLPIRRTLRDGDWTPVARVVEERAIEMANLGVSFDEWIDFALLTQRHVTPLLVAAHASKPAFLAAVLTAMQDFWQRALLTARAGYARARDAMNDDSVRALRRSEEALRRSERLFRAIVETSPDAVSLLDRDGMFLYASPTAANLAARSGTDMVGTSVFDLIAPQDLADYKQKWSECVEQPGVLLHHEFRMAMPDGSTRYRESLRINHLNDPNLCAIVSLVRDVAERRRLEEQLRQSQKMEAIGTLAGGVAHDFNNLLSVVLGYSELLLSTMPEKDPMRGDLEEIRDAGKHAASLTGQLLAFSRKQVLSPRVMRLTHAVTGMERMARRLIGEHIELVTLTQASVGNVLADPGQMEQVLLNLVVNARDAMPRGGKLVVETADVDVDPRHAANLGIEPGPCVLLAVSDSGIGMDKATLGRIFEPFFTTKADRGTGLGLATVFGIVRQSGGAISVYSEPDRGTTFRVYLPRTDAIAALATQVAHPTALRGTETILLVEDADAVRHLAHELLRRQGYQVLEASNPGEALLVAEQHPTPIELLLTDMVMPKMTGPELAGRLALHRPAMKVLYMSGYTENTVVHNGVLQRAIAFLAKPLTPGTLLTKVRETLDTG
jgi:two-component system, cell cycle sensor histidine kinase and response regulator CckA